MMQFLTSCVACSMADVPDLHSMVDNAEDIEHDDFRDDIGEEAYTLFEEAMGYGGCLRLSDDWAVSFHRSNFKGQPVTYCVHSSIEYIFAA